MDVAHVMFITQYTPVFLQQEKQGQRLENTSREGSMWEATLSIGGLVQTQLVVQTLAPGTSEGTGKGGNRRFVVVWQDNTEYMHQHAPQDVSIIHAQVAEEFACAPLVFCNRKNVEKAKENVKRFLERLKQGGFTVDNIMEDTLQDMYEPKPGGYVEHMSKS